MTDEIHPTQQACLEAIDRIARTPDGALLYVHLQRRLMLVPIEMVRGALRQDVGERRFASQLIGLMAKGVSESGGRTGITGSTSGPDGREQPLVVPKPEPRRVAGTGSRRRVGEHTVVAGWNDNRDGGDAA